MFITIQAHEYDKHCALLDQMHRLRKRVFFDELGWEVPVQGDWERDRYDDLGPAYLVWCSPNKQILYGTMRLMPTTGPTLLYDVFHDTFPHAATLSAPGIWEATRTCVDLEKLASDHPGVDAAKAFGMMCLATAECANQHGIHTVICNYEPHLARIYRRAGAVIQELGRSDNYGRRPVCCGAFYISQEMIASMHAALGIDLPLYRTTIEDGPARTERAA